MKPMRKREIRFIVAQILVLVCFSVAFVSCGGGGKAKAKKQEGSPVPEKMGTPGINESLNSLNSANNTNGNVIHPANISLGEMNNNTGGLNGGASPTPRPTSTTAPSI